MSVRAIHFLLITLALITALEAQTITTAIAVDAAGTEYAGGAGATVSRAGGWQIRLGKSDNDLVRALLVAPDGSFIATGSLDGGGFIARISSNGERTGWTVLDRAARAHASDRKGAIYAAGEGFSKSEMYSSNRSSGSNPAMEIEAVVQSRTRKDPALRALHFARITLSR